MQKIMVKLASNWWLDGYADMRYAVAVSTECLLLLLFIIIIIVVITIIIISIGRTAKA